MSEKKKRLKEYQKIIMRPKSVFHKCKYVNKSGLQIAIANIFFVLSFINF